MAQTREAALAYLAGQLAAMLLQQTKDVNIPVVVSERISTIMSPGFGDPYPPDAERPQLRDDITSEWSSSGRVEDLVGFEWATVPLDAGIEAYVAYVWNWYSKNARADDSGNRVAMTRADIVHMLRVRIRPEQ